MHSRGAVLPEQSPQDAKVQDMVYSIRKMSLRENGGRERRCVRIISKMALSAIAFFFAVLCFARAASAQDLNSNNIFVGYSFLASNLFSGQHANLNGWNVSAEKKYLPFFGVVADFAGLYGSKNLPSSSSCAGSSQCLVHSSVSEYSFQAGIRGSYASKTVRPFAEALFGAVHTGESGPGLSNSNNGFSATLGAGIDCRLTRMLGCRVNAYYIVTGNFTARQNSVGASTGLVFRF
jgi:hypothetical protein